MENNINNVLGTLKEINIIQSVIIIVISIILYKVIAHFLNKSEKRLLSNKKSRTYIRLIRNIIRYIFIILTVLVLLQINGINVSSILAGVGIAGAIIGLAIQDWLKDIIRGTTILSDTYFEVGDIVKFNDIEGKVILIGLKTTKIQDLKTSNILVVANRNIEIIEKVSNLVYINVPMPYEIRLEEAENVIEKINQNIKTKNNIFDSRYRGVNELADSSIKYLIEVECDQSFKLQVRRDALRCVLEEMTKAGISVPYNQIDVHNK